MVDETVKVLLAVNVAPIKVAIGPINKYWCVYDTLTRTAAKGAPPPPGEIVTGVTVVVGVPARPAAVT